MVIGSNSVNTTSYLILIKYIFLIHFTILDNIIIDGAIRILSDNFSAPLSNPESQLFQETTGKYITMVITIFKNPNSNIHIYRISVIHKILICTGEIVIYFSRRENEI